MEKDSAVQVLDKFLAQNPNHVKSAAAAAYSRQNCGRQRTSNKSVWLFWSSRDPVFSIIRWDRASICIKQTRISLPMILRMRMNGIRVVWKEYERISFLSLRIRRLKILLFLNWAYAAKSSWIILQQRNGMQNTCQGIKLQPEPDRHFMRSPRLQRRKFYSNSRRKYLQEVSRIAGKSGGQSLSVAFETAEMLFQNEPICRCRQKI